MAARLCVCGRSRRYPVCDNSHQDEDWSCQLTGGVQALYGFCASRCYQNVAWKLAAHHKGAVYEPGSEEPQVDTLVLILDGGDLEHPLGVWQRLAPRRLLVVCFGQGAPWMKDVFPGGEIYAPGSADGRHAFKVVQEILEGSGQRLDGGSAASVEPRSLFVSHAVRDEPVLMPAIETLRRHYQARIFTCGDSIPSGSHWQAQIEGALRGMEVFVMILSRDFLASHFCAFEIGFALALDKPMVTLSLDGSLPPPFVQHLQMIDVPRRRRLTPWLEPGDIVLDALLGALSAEPG